MFSQPRQGPIPPGSAHQKVKEKDVSKKFQYLYTTMKIVDIEAPGRQRAKPTGDETRVYQVKLTALLLFK